MEPKDNNYIASPNTQYTYSFYYIITLTKANLKYFKYSAKPKDIIHILDSALSYCYYHYYFDQGKPQRH